MEVGKRITELRKVKGYTVNRLANEAGVSQSYLRDIELGNKQPTVEYLEYICYGLGVSLSAFFKTEEESELERLLASLSPEQQSSLIAFLRTLGANKA